MAGDFTFCPWGPPHPENELKDAHCVSNQLPKLASSWVSWAAASPFHMLLMHPLGIANIYIASGYAEGFATAHVPIQSPLMTILMKPQACSVSA